MKKLFTGSLTLITLVALLSSCNCFNKMRRNIDKVDVKCNPQVLALKGNQVPASYSLVFPAKYFKPTTVLKVTPVLVFKGGELAGAPMFIQGNKVKDNYTVVNYKTGGTVTGNVSFPFKEEMRQATLELRMEAKCAKKSNKAVFVPFGTVTVAQGISCVQSLADNYAQLAMCPDNFKRMTQISQDAKIMFLINKFDVRKDQLNKEDIKALENFIASNSDNSRRTVSNVYTKSYASPDGPLTFNDKLSKERGKATEKAMNSKFGKDKKLNKQKFDVEALGEDWEGFKELVEKSDIPDKELILQVLQMYSNPEKRDQEIKNMTAAFDVLAKKVLPELRRSRMVVNVDIQGLTDEELRTAVNNNIDKLNIEEQLFAATLFESNADKMEIYKKASEQYNDARAWNNYGVTLVRAGKINEAQSAFNRAAELNKNSNEILNNLGVMAMAQGNTQEAQRYFSALNTPEAKYNSGLLNLASGNYADAARELNGYNLAVAEVCNGNLSKAQAALQGDETAQADYLRAVIAARQGNNNAVISNLQSAISKDNNWRNVAKTDIEFAKLFGAKEFMAL